MIEKPGADLKFNSPIRSGAESDFCFFLLRYGTLFTKSSRSLIHLNLREGAMEIRLCWSTCAGEWMLVKVQSSFHKLYSTLLWKSQ